MAIQLGIHFPSELEEKQRHSLSQQSMTPHERLLAVVDILAAADALSRAGGVRAAQLAYQENLEKEWQEIMKRFINEHLSA